MAEKKVEGFRKICTTCVEVDSANYYLKVHLYPLGIGDLHRLEPNVEIKVFRFRREYLTIIPKIFQISYYFSSRRQI